jgi:hypothetical protein
MRLVIISAALIGLSFPALAQPQPGRPPAPPRPPQAQPQPPAPAPAIFACRTQAEVCHVGIAADGGQILLLFSNAPQGQGSEGRTIAVQGADLGQSVGKVVMLTGELGPSGITGAQVVDTAGPLLSFVIKQMSADDAQQGGQGQRGAPPARGGPPPRR